MSRGRFITLEGGEGTGKSTQGRLLAERLQGLGHEVVITREPGGSAGAEAIRDLLVRGSVDRWSAVTETLMMYAARRDHIERLIRPSLDRGAIVISDRFADSTRAYQGIAGDAPAELIKALEREVLEGVRPDLTLVLDLPFDIGLARAHSRQDMDTRFEAKGEDYHARLRQAFLQIARGEPDRCVVVDAAGTIEQVQRAIWAAVRERLELEDA